MSILNKKEALILFLGDILFFVVALWFTLLFRYIELPSMETWSYHIVPFSILFIFWILVFYIAGLYEKHTLILRSSLPNVLFNTQIINSIIAISFFYFIPYFKIAPKTNLFIYLVLSMGLIFVWRLFIFKLLAPRRKDGAMLVGVGDEVDELYHEVNNNNLYSFNFVEKINPNNIDARSVADIIRQQGISLVVVDLHDRDVVNSLPGLYDLIFLHVQFIDKYDLYESLFDRISISSTDYGWLLKNISSQTHTIYDFAKRTFDLVSALILGLASLLIYPIIWLAIKMDDGGSLFYLDERVGQNGKTFKLIKFRSMMKNDGGIDSISSVGKFLRKTRLDELPQLWNVLKGNLSLIGPRPERTDLSRLYNNEMPFYNVRHIIKPGLSGWAQLRHDNHPHHGPDTEATREKLSYDLYYIKNRSVWLDFKIALQTFKIILSQKGR